ANEKPQRRRRGTRQIETLPPALLERRREHFAQFPSGEVTEDPARMLALKADDVIEGIPRAGNDIDEIDMAEKVPHRLRAQCAARRELMAVAERLPIGERVLRGRLQESKIPINRNRRQFGLSVEAGGGGHRARTMRSAAFTKCKQFPHMKLKRKDL